VSGDPNAAPPGAFHFWDIGQYGHVGVDLNGGGSSVFMASRKLSDAWGDAIGVNSVGGYNAASGARYMGWSMDYAGSRMPGAGEPGPAPAPSNGPVPRTSTQEDGIPGSNFYKRLQLFARSHGYTGPIDGVMGKNSWAGVQRGLQASAGYTGPADGVPGANTYKAMQTLAARSGYTGPIDGALGPNSYRGLAAFLNSAV
jgi:peptidoglycan hydrolase-like protein with peptidoglycan-binding domain